MSSRAREYTLDQKSYQRYLKRDGEVKCVSCGKELKVGDRVVSHGTYCSRQFSKKNLRCIPCARKLNIV